jgi:hypothetical protein
MVQLELPALHTSGAQSPFEQNCSGLQSFGPTQLTQYPWAWSQTSPILVHCRSDMHFGRHVCAAQRSFAGQSLSPTQSTQRPTSFAHTCPCGHASEFMHGVYGRQLWLTQSLFAGQSPGPTQTTHLPEVVSQALPLGEAAQSALLVQRGMGATH